MKWSPEEESKLSNYVINTIVDRALGQADEECRSNYPRDTYFLGNLRPQDSDPADARVAVRELLNKLAPSATGWELAIKAKDRRTKFNVGLSWTVYYRVFPSFGQQRDYQVRITANPKADQPEPTSAEPPIDSTPETIPDSASVQAPKSKDAMAPRFKSIRCQAQSDVEARAGTESIIDIQSLQTAINFELERAKTIWQKDPERIRARSDPNEYVQVPLEALALEQEYRAIPTLYR